MTQERFCTEQARMNEAELLSIANEQDLTRAIDLMRSGVTIGFQTITYGLMGDTSRPSILETINGSKHRAKKKPIAIAIPSTNWISEMADLNRIDPALHHVINDPSELEKRLSGKMMIKLPIKAGQTLNGHELTSHADSDEHGPWLLMMHYGKVQPYAQHLVERAYNEGIGLLGVSSMNHTGEPTITERRLALQYASSNGIPIVIADPTEAITARRGSHLIVAVARSGEVIPMQNRTLDQSVILLRSQGNLDARHAYCGWPEVFGEQEVLFAEVVGKLAPGLFNLAANRTAAETLESARTQGMLTIHSSPTLNPKPPLVK